MKPVKEPTRAGNIVDGNAHATPTAPMEVQKQAENIVDRVTKLIQKPGHSYLRECSRPGAKARKYGPTQHTRTGTTYLHHP